MLKKDIDNYKDMTPQEIHHGAYITKGHMIAMPLGFPGVTTPINSNDSFVTSLTIGPDEVIYGGTSGQLAHIFAAFTRGPTGIVVDLKGDNESNECVRVVCTEKQIIAGVNSKSSGRILTRNVSGLSDCVQEWGFDVSPFKVAVDLPKGLLIIDLISDNEDGIVGTTQDGLFYWQEKTNNLVFYKDIKITNLTTGNEHKIYGIDGEGQIYLINKNKSKGVLDIKLGNRVKGNWKNAGIWSTTNLSDVIYLADGDGQLFRISSRGKAEKIGHTDLSPITCMTVSNDGRLFGFCGHKMANLFEYEPRGNTLLNFGVAISVLNVRRYGYEFACAVTGKDGEIYFGENDRGGHLWVYFPSLLKK